MNPMRNKIVDFHIWTCVVVCCVAWMTRPGRRPFPLDVLPWLCVAGLVACDGVPGAVFAWLAVLLAYFSIRFNRLESPATPARQS
jgi:hypothetical protein